MLPKTTKDWIVFYSIWLLESLSWVPRDIRRRGQVEWISLVLIGWLVLSLLRWILKYREEKRNTAP